MAVSLLAYRPGRIGGAETYLRALVSSLPAEADAGELLLVLHPEAATALGETPGWRRVLVERSDRELVARRALEAFTPWRDRALERVLEECGAGVVLFPQQSIYPATLRLPSVLVVHDLQHLHHPGNFGLADRAFRAAVYGRSLARATRVIAISGETRRQLVEECGVDGGKVSVVGHGVSPMPEPPAEGSRPVPFPYLYYPAATYRHKGHEILLRSYAALRRRGALAEKLVLSGQRTGEWARLRRLASSLGVADAVVHLGFVPRERVWALYAGAEAVVIPSQYEGFGLPVLEAVAARRRVVASRLAAFEELGMPPEWLIDFADPEALLRALRQPGPTTLARSHPTWQGVARATLEVLRAAARRA